MASWILSQQWLLSVVILLLLANERYGSRLIGGIMSYRLWLIIPALLGINYVAQHINSVNSSEITRYIVNINEQSAQLGELVTWQIVWGIGAMVIAVLSFAETLNTRFSHRLTPIDSRSLSVDIPSHLKVYQTAEASSPMLIGILSPKLIIPSNFYQQYTPIQQQLILEHELCHHQRKDNLINILAMITLSLCWFNPIAWFGYRSFRKSQEIACDSYVLQHKSTSQRLEYGKALIHCAQSAQFGLCIDANYTQRNIMFKRINMLKDHKLVSRPAQAVITIFVGILVTSIAFSTPSMPEDTSQNVTPTYRIEPHYPLKAVEEGTEGSVLLKFDVDTTGNVTNISIVQATPSDIFNATSRKAVKQWKYKTSNNGMTDVYVQLDYRLDNSATESVNLMSDIERIKVRNH